MIQNMHINSAKLIKCLLGGIVLMCVFEVHAQTCGENCEEPPSCTELGYIHRSKISCLDSYITCPFDGSYIWCKEYTCEDGRYLSYNASEISNGCIEVNYHGLTCMNCDCKGYLETSCPTGAICSSCDLSGTIKYRIDDCVDGYTMQFQIGTGSKSCKKKVIGDVIPESCTEDYTLLACPEGAICSQCKLQYRVDSCETGYMMRLNITTGLKTCTKK